MTETQEQLLKRFKRGQLLTRQQVLDLGSDRPAADIKELRRAGFLIVYIHAKTPFWVAPELAEAANVVWSKRVMDKIKEA